MNFKPTPTKIIISVLISLVGLYLAKMYYGVYFCKDVSCIAMYIPCDYCSFYACCQGCASLLILVLQVSLSFLTLFVITYSIYSWFSSRFTKWQKRKIWLWLGLVSIIFILYLIFKIYSERH